MKDPVENLEGKTHLSESGFEPERTDATIGGATSSAPKLGERYKVIEELNALIEWKISGEPDKAIAALTKEIDRLPKRDPNHIGLYPHEGLGEDRIKRDHLELRGRIYQALGKGEKALVDFDEAVRLSTSGDSLSARVSLEPRGDCYFALGAYDKALREYQRVSWFLIPENPELHGKRGIAYAALGDYKHAAEEFANAATIYRCKFRADEWNRPFPLGFYFTEERRDGERNEALHRLGRAIMIDRLGDKQLAKELYEEAISRPYGPYVFCGEMQLIEAYVHHVLNEPSEREGRLKTAKDWYGLKKEQLQTMLFKDIPSLRLDW